MADIVHKISVSASAADVYQKIATIEGLKEWWTENTEGESKESGSISFKFPETGPVVEVLELMDQEFIKWKCTDGPEEWINTVFTFELEEKDGVTEVLFAHLAWEDQTDFFAHCNTKWATFMLSLKEVCEGKKGHAFPNDIPIDVKLAQTAEATT